MDLSDLRVLNVPKSSREAAVPPPPLADTGRCFVLDTCQRRLLVAAADPGTSAAPAADPAWLRGAEAFRFLLETAAGLQSAVLGETEILAQLKAAWAGLERTNVPAARELRPWMQLVFADAKEVREQFLRGTGGQSYGSLLRHVLGEIPHGPVLLLGAGDLAARILPWLAGTRVLLWNRTTERAAALRDAHGHRVACPVHVVPPAASTELAAWREAALVVACVPADQGRDAARVAAWRGLDAAARPRIVHLGLLAAGNSAWRDVPGLVTLETLFAADRAQGDLRAGRIAMARRWCGERAQLRALDRCVTVPHGWEDLARFAACGHA